MSQIVVIALGGNALLRGNEIGSISEQERNSRRTAENLINLIKQGYEIIITHGNGPQVGNIVLRNEAGYSKYKIPRMPLDICVADSQGGIGYMLERQLLNTLNENKIKKNVITLVTQVLVDKNDIAFKDPTKPIGGFYLKEEAQLLQKSNSWIFKEDPRKRGWRRVVPSPKPIEILNRRIVHQLSNEGNIVIASGGGGVPVYLDEIGNLQRVEAVIDKDLAASLLAQEVNADKFIILTDVPKVCLNFNKPNQIELDTITISEAEKYIREDHFSDGSMLPKIQAAINFVKVTGKEAIITDASELTKNLEGTKIIK